MLWLYTNRVLSALINAKTTWQFIHCVNDLYRLTHIKTANMTYSYSLVTPCEMRSSCAVLLSAVTVQLRSLQPVSARSLPFKSNYIANLQQNNK